MRTSSKTELRRNLMKVLDRIAADHDPVLITRDRGKPAAVLMSLETFASHGEIHFLLQSPRNAERLLAAIAELEAGGGAVRKLIE